MDHSNIEISISRSFFSVLYLTFILLLIGNHTIYAQGSGSISGKAIDKTSGEPLLYANVHLEGTSLGTSTDDCKFAC